MASWHKDSITQRIDELLARTHDPSLASSEVAALVAKAGHLIERFGRRRTIGPAEKKCRLCGRVGTRDFVNHGEYDRAPSWMGPWYCRWDGPCWERRQAIEKVLAETDELLGIKQPTVIDLDALQAGGGERHDDVR